MSLCVRTNLQRERCMHGRVKSPKSDSMDLPNHFFWDVGDRFSQECLLTGLFPLWLVVANFRDTC